MFSYISSIYHIPALRWKVAVTLLMIVIFRFGTYVPIPGVNTSEVSRVAEERQGGKGTAASKTLDIINLFTGGALGRCSIFALGIMPYISASIIFQLLGTVIKRLEELQREGEAGRRKINQYTRYATVVLCLVQSLFMCSWIESAPDGFRFVSAATARGPWFELTCMLSLTAGSVFLMWLGETVTERGIGNGISVLIMAGIVDRVPVAFRQLWGKVNWSRPFTPEAGGDSLNVMMLVFFLAMYIGIVVGVVIITRGERRIKIRTSQKVQGRVIKGGQANHLPLRVNHAGVIPIIFAQSLLTIPNMIFGSLAGRWAFFAFLAGTFTMGSFTYTMVYVLMIFFFCYFWTAVVFNPEKVAREIQEGGAFVEGFRPGKSTEYLLTPIVTRMTLAGAAFLSFIAILPQLVQNATQIGYVTAGLYGGTSLLIVVGVALEVVRTIDAELEIHKRKTAMKARSR